MRKQVKVLAQKEDLKTPADAATQQPIDKQVKQLPSREINRLDIRAFEANMKQTAEVPKEKPKLNIDMTQRMKAFTPQTQSSDPQRQAKIVPGRSVREIASLYEKPKDSSSKKVEVPSNFISLKDRKAALGASQQQAGIRKEQAAVSKTIEERKEALFSAGQTTNTPGSKSNPIDVKTSLQSRMDTLQSNFKQKETEKNEEIKTGLSIKERVAILNEQKRFDLERARDAEISKGLLKDQVTPFDRLHESKEERSGYSYEKIVADVIPQQISTEAKPEPKKIRVEVVPTEVRSENKKIISETEKILTGAIPKKLIPSGETPEPQETFAKVMTAPQMAPSQFKLDLEKKLNAGKIKAQENKVSTTIVEHEEEKLQEHLYDLGKVDVPALPKRNASSKKLFSKPEVQPTEEVSHAKLNEIVKELERFGGQHPR